MTLAADIVKDIRCFCFFFFKTCCIAVFLSDKQPYKEDIKMLAEDLHYFYFFLRMLTS
jgi:hypothetical protein